MFDVDRVQFLFYLCI